MELQHSYDSTFGSYGRYGGVGYSSMGYGGYGDTSLPSTAGSSSTVLGYDAGGGYSANMSSFSTASGAPLDEQQIYERLANQSYKSRADILDYLKNVLRRSATALPYNNPELIFDGLALALSDSTWDVRQQAIQVVRDALPKTADHITPCMNIVMPLLIENIGDRKATVRKGVTQALHCYLKQPKADSSTCLNALITHGFNSSDPEVVREVVAIVPVLLTQDIVEAIDVSRLLDELMRKLPAEGQPVKERIEQLALSAIEKIRNTAGESRFREAQDRCPRATRRRYIALQSDGANDADSDFEPDNFSSRLPSQPVNVAANNSRNSLNTNKNTANVSEPSAAPVMLNNSSSSKTGSSYASVVASSLVTNAASSNESKYFGIIPGDIYSKLMDDNPRTRLEGADELKAIITRLQSGIVLHSSLSDLLRFLSDFLDDANFKVVTTTLEIFLLLIKTAVDIRPHVGTLVDAVGRRMSDAKLLIRQGVSSVMIQLMRLVSAMPVLELAASYFKHKNSRMRQESLNLMIAAMLTFPKEDFDYEFIASAVVPLLLDSKFQVRQAAMECVSVMAHLLNPDISVLMRAIHKVEDANPADSEGLASAIKVRAARHQLPRLNSDGLVEYSVALPGSASQRAARPMPPGSDTSLILAATGGHSAARPSQSIALFNQGGDDSHTGPKTPLSGKVRLPWQSQQPSTTQSDQLNKRNNNSHGFFDPGDANDNNASKRNKADGVDGPQRSDSPHMDVWNVDDYELGGLRVPPPKHRTSQALVRPTQLPITNNNGQNATSNQSEREPPSTKKSIANKDPRQVANSVALELSARAALDQPQTLTPPENVRQRGSASQRRAQRIFDRLESEDTGDSRNVRNSQQKLNGSVKSSLKVPSENSSQMDDYSPKMPHRKVPALEKAFFIDLGDDKPLRPPPKFKSRTNKAQEDVDEPLQEQPRRQSKNQSSTNGLAFMDVEFFEQSSSNADNSFPLPMRPARPERKSLPDQNNHPYHQQYARNSQQQRDQGQAQRSTGHFEAAEPHHRHTDNSPKGRAVQPSRIKAAFLATSPLQPQSNYYSSEAHDDDRALMEEDVNGVQRPRKQPPPIKQPAISLGAINSHSQFGGDNSFNASNDGEQFFSKAFVPPNRQRNNQSTALSQVNGFKESSQEPTFPGNATYSYLANMEPMSGSGSVSSTSPPNNRNLGFPSRDDLSRQSTHSLVAEERLRSGDERMIEKYEELKRRQKAFLRALSANFASDVTAAEQASLGTSSSSGCLSASDHRQGTAPPHFGDMSNSAPVKAMAGRRPQKLKPVAPPAGYQPPQNRTTPRKNFSPGGATFSAFTVNAQLRTADLPYDQLPEPQPNGARALNDAATALANEDWEVKCEGINILRSVVKHQPHALTESPNGNQLHTINLSMISEMRNLRSQVARLAIQCVREMFLQLKRAMEIDAENMTKVLLGRSGDTNQFLRADAELALTAIANSLHPNKAMTAFLQGGLGHRNVSVRRSTAQHLLEVVERMGAARALAGMPEVTGNLMPAMLQFLMDGSPETRFHARKLCHLLLTHGDFDKMLNKYCAPNTIAHARDVIETVRMKGPGELTSLGSSSKLSDYGSSPSAMSGLSPMSSAHSGSLSTVGSPMKPRAPARRLDESTLDNVRTIIAQMASNNWRERYEGISSLVQMTEASPEVTASQLTKLFDKFCPLLKDMNSKVNLCALQAFQSILPMISNEIGPLIPLVMQHLTINLSSRSHEIQQTAAGAMHSMLAYIDPSSLLQPFANQTQTANSRNKAFMIDRLSEIVDSVCDRKMKQVTLHILPLLWHLLGSVTQSGALPGGAGNIRHSTARLASVLHQHMGDDLLQHAGAASLPEKNYNLLQELLRASSSTGSSNSKSRGGPTIGEDLDNVVEAN